MSSDLTRRDFVRLGAGAVAVGAALDPASMFATDEAPDKLRFASIGLGVRGCELLKTALQLPGAECAMLADLYEGRKRAGCEIAGVATPATSDYREVLDRQDVAAVIVAMPDHLHRRIVVEACAAGKDVYCEKPMSHNVEDGFAMVEASHRYNRILQAGSQRVSSVAYGKAREIYHSGRLGEVCYIQAHSDRNSPSGAWVYPIPPDANEKTIRWAGFIEDAPARDFDAVRFFRWRCFKDYGEGLPGDLYVHLISGIHFITGNTAPPRRAVAAGGLYRFKDGRDFPDLIQTIYEYEGYQTSVRCNLNNEAGEAIVFHGTAATMTVSGNSVTVKAQDTRPHPEGYSLGGWPSDQRALYYAAWNAEHPATPPLQSVAAEDTEVFEAPAGYNDTLDHMAAFFASVRTRKPPVEDGEFGANAAIACHMANYSYFNRTAAVWDAAARKIKS